MRNLALLLCAALTQGSPNLTIAQSGTIDSTFAASIRSAGGANGSVLCATPDTAGNVIIGGSFTQFAGISANRIARVLANGTVDTAFTSAVGLIGNAVTAIVVQSDAKILVGGNFSSIGGAPQAFLARLNNDGTLDTSFAPSLNLPVFAIAVQPDGAVIIGGQFFSPGFTRRGIARLLSDGALDLSFDPGIGANNTLRAIALNENGQLLVAGAFTLFNSTPVGRVVLLDATGAIAPGFTPTSGADDVIYCAQSLLGGKVVLGGAFDSFNGTSTPALVCLAADGSIDLGTPTVGFSNADLISSLITDQNGLLIAGGNFPGYQGGSSPRIVRLAADGARDPSFIVGTGFTGSTVSSLSMDPQGRVVAGGTFTQYQGTTQNNLTRIENCLMLEYYADIDGDGLGDQAFSVTACAPPMGHVLDNTDCDDTDPLVLGPVTWYADVDGDGFGNPATSIQSCSIVPGHVLDNTDCDDTDPLVLGPVTLYADADGDGFGNPASSIQNCSDVSGYVQDNTDCDDSDPLRAPGAACNDGQELTTADAYDATCVCKGTAVRVAARAFLQGPYTGGGMNGALRINGLLPVDEPYTALGMNPDPLLYGGDHIDLILGSGPNAFIDWVMLELRSAANPQQLVYTRMCMLQNDGDIVETQPIGPVRFPVPAGEYHLVLKHRNHLGVMTATPLPIVADGVVHTVDFTLPSTACFGTNARVNSGGTMLLWAGNVNGGNQISYTGGGNDRDPILLAVGNTTPNNVVTGVYSLRDTNMDGAIRYVGGGNDREVILTNVGGTTPNSTRTAQLP